MVVEQMQRRKTKSGSVFGRASALSLGSSGSDNEDAMELSTPIEYEGFLSKPGLMQLQKRSVSQHTPCSKLAHPHADALIASHVSLALAHHSRPWHFYPMPRRYSPLRSFVVAKRGTLSYYTKRFGSDKPKGRLNLRGATVKALPPGQSRHSYCFGVNPLGGDSTHVFVCSSARELKDWLVVLISHGAIDPSLVDPGPGILFCMLLRVLLCPHTL